VPARVRSQQFKIRSQQFKKDAEAAKKKFGQSGPIQFSRVVILEFRANSYLSPTWLIGPHWRPVLASHLQVQKVTGVQSSALVIRLHVSVLALSGMVQNGKKPPLPDSQEFPNRLRYQLVFPALYRRRRVACQQRDEGEQRQPRIAHGVVKRIPVLAVFAVVVRDDILKVVSFL
jgi:hypothetical protein